jgi:hypothetical protein
MGRLRKVGPPEQVVAIELLGGNCPVEVAGTVDRRAFHFRARGSRWRFWLATDDDVSRSHADASVTTFSNQPHFFLEGEYGPGPFDAGWMRPEEARRLVEDCARDYLRQGRRP